MATSSGQTSLEISYIMNILSNYSSNLTLLYLTLQLNSTPNTTSQDVTQHVSPSSRALKHNAGQGPMMRVDQHLDSQSTREAKKKFVQPGLLALAVMFVRKILLHWKRIQDSIRQNFLKRNLLILH